MDFKKYAVMLKQYQGRGSVYLSLFLLISANAKLFENYLSMLGMTVGEAIIAGVVTTVLIGWVDYHYGIWKAENDYVWNMTPSAEETLKRVKNIEEMLKGRLP